jgi:hypothetical protein
MRIGLGSGIGSAIVSASALAFLAATPSAGAAPRAVQRHLSRLGATPVTIGAVVGDPGSAASCATAPEVGVELNTPSYVVPSAGVVTGFSFQANAHAGLVRVLFAVPAPVPGHFTIVSKSPLQTVVPNTLDTFPVRVPVEAGQLLGLESASTGVPCVYGGDTSDLAATAVLDPDVSTDLEPSAYDGSARLNVSAVIEPDTDGDGFGDLTQDACPASPGSSTGCQVARTTVTKRPGRTTRHRRIKVRFGSSVPGSTFACSLDGGRFRPCASPYKKRLAVGKHTILVQATGPDGTVEPSPARVRFRILPPKQH